jgi:putative two-component system response regulator
MEFQLEDYYQKETKAIYTDGLTGLFNHGFFQICLDREVKRSERYGSPFTLALIDIDSFSTYNKRMGHLQGDRILKEIAGRVMRNIRQVDLPARYSGDILSVIFVNSGIQTALVPVERIRHSIEKMYGGAVTISVGLSSFPQEAKNGETLIRKAHEALLQAKIKGKNRVYFFGEEPGPVDGHKSRILIADDEPRNLKLLEALLLPLNYEVIKVSNGEDALTLLNKIDIDLIFLDILMPYMDGYEVCRRLKGSEATRLIPVVMITALDDLESRIKGIEAGAEDFISKPPNRLELLARSKSLIKIKKLNSSLTSIENVLISLANAVEAKDPYTQGHILRVSNLAVALGKKKGMPIADIEALRWGGILHDIGKIGVPHEVLNKRGSLAPEEWEIIKGHPDRGHSICLPLKKVLGPALEAIRYHHEKLDGSGYPLGLKGDEISAVPRIMAVVDFYDALVTDRPYRKAVQQKDALAILRQEADSGKLDKEVVGYLIGIYETGGNAGVDY